MTEIISVRFKSGGKQYYFDPKGQTVSPGQGVIIETSRGVEYAECVQGNFMIEDDAVIQPLRPLVRIATARDLEIVARNHEKEGQAFQICQEKIAAHGLDMKLVDVEYNFDGSKILFFFTSDGRVDFRALVKDLASVFHTRIELRQIGVRDEAKMLGGLGICGKPFCCATFLDEFQPVSIKMAKTQNLSLNPTKISGTCGRLMCCLKYEQEAYEDAVKRMPKSESFVETPDGVGTISQVNLLRETVKVRLDDQPENNQCYQCCEICVVRSGKGKRPEGYVAPPPEELEKLRKVTPPPLTQEDKLSVQLGAVLDSIKEPDRESRRKTAHKPKQDDHRDRPKPQRQEHRPKQERPPRQDHPIEQHAVTGEKRPNRNRRRYRPRPKHPGGKPPAPPTGI
ncbi:MAG: stage 0 sporulation family protein [Oscillospiraceae bacterium]|nr:stage 0 sporulation family protein [Oscillospiraceae bacterium]